MVPWRWQRRRLSRFVLTACCIKYQFAFLGSISQDRYINVCDLYPPYDITIPHHSEEKRKRNETRKATQKLWRIVCYLWLLDVLGVLSKCGEQKRKKKKKWHGPKWPHPFPFSCTRQQEQTGSATGDEGFLSNFFFFLANFLETLFLHWIELCLILVIMEKFMIIILACVFIHLSGVSRVHMVFVVGCVRKALEWFRRSCGGWWHDWLWRAPWGWHLHAFCKLVRACAESAHVYFII